eukprot:4902842-Pleurochrysis_carterae.AAC.3
MIEDGQRMHTVLALHCATAAKSAAAAMASPILSRMFAMARTLATRGSRRCDLRKSSHAAVKSSARLASTPRC